MILLILPIMLNNTIPQDDCHSEWVSCVRFSPNAQNPAIVSCGWDRVVKVGWLPLYCWVMCYYNGYAVGMELGQL